MPRGVYPRKRTPEQEEAWKENLAKGRTKQAQEKAAKTKKEKAKDPDWRARIGELTKEAMHKPEIRERHINNLMDHFGYDSVDPNKVTIPFRTTFPIAHEYVVRFWSRVEIKDTNSCWINHCGGKYKVYGSFWNGTEEILAHRFSMMLKLGRELNEGEQVLHSCDNPPCCNPNHLFLGDNATNVADKMAKGRHRTLSGDAHPGIKLTLEKAREIRELHKQGWTLTPLAKRFNVGRGTIRSIIHNRIWKEPQ